MARATVQKCVRCNKARPKMCQQIMGNLPQARITPARPFVNSGVDYFGPLWIHYKIRGKRPTKAYVAVFCCFASKAVHLELVSDLTTDAFIGALKRFISRRGRCQNIYSDNATNFIGANNKLVELSESIFSEHGKDSVTSTCSSKGIQFHFIPPRSPHFGGLWEAAVKSAKHLLVRSIGTASLTYEELETVIVEIEAILNSRPLTPMTNDPSDMSALTPGHLLIGEAPTSQVDSAASSKRLSLLSRWELVSQLKLEFWRRWSTEYLNELQQRQKWNKQQPNLKIGNMVIIKEDNLPVMKWPLGRIMQIHTGDDGIVRVVEVKTAHGLFKRPIHRLALLPIDKDQEETVQDNNDIPEARDEPKAKKKRMILNTPSLTTALFVIMLIMPLAWASEVVNTKFTSDVGIHFEGIGQVKTSRTNWQLVVYYELDPYWRELQAFSNGTLALRQLCQEMKQSISCRNLITVLNHVEDGLILDNSILPTTRNKRGAFNIVGNIANSLFGVLDSEYAKQMTNTIELVKGNDVHLLSLLKNQTSILDATINIIKQDEASIKKKLDQLDAQSTEILARINGIAEEEYQSQIFQTFISLSLQLTIAAANLQRIKSSILDVLTDTHHGKISPNLLSAKQLEVELIKIRNYLPPSLQIPVDHDNHLQLYKLMKVEGGLTKDHVIFKITIPLCDQETFELYKLYPVPNILNNSLIAIKLCDEMLAMSPHRDQYFPMNSATLNACTLTKEDTYLCSNVQSKYNKGSEICSCEIELLNNNTNSVCNLERLSTNVTWTQLSSNNKWMYAFN